MKYGDSRLHSGWISVVAFIAILIQIGEHPNLGANITETGLPENLLAWISVSFVVLFFLAIDTFKVMKREGDSK